jgi:hypothetical protein
MVILGVLKIVFGSLRVGEEEEIEGLDFSEHGESAYSSPGGLAMAPEAAGHGAPISIPMGTLRQEATRLV